MTRVLVTGASGFVGSAAAGALVAAGAQVIGTGRRPRPQGLDRRIAYHRWDLLDGTAAAPTTCPDVVLHCAAMVDDWAPLSRQLPVTVGGTRAALAAWPGVRFVLVSTASVYPPWRAGLVCETDGPDPRPVGPYPAAKAAAERLALALTPQRSVLVLRPHAVYGPGDPTLLPRLRAAVRPIGRNGLLVVPGPARTRVHLTHVDTLAQACVAGCLGTSRGVVNVADAAPVRLDEALDQVLGAVLGRRPARVHLPTGASRALATMLEAAARLTRRPRAPALTRYLVSQLGIDRELDLTRLRAELGVQPAPTDFRDAAWWGRAP